jgi:hypothetical protein
LYPTHPKRGASLHGYTKKQGPVNIEERKVFVFVCVFLFISHNTYTTKKKLINIEIKNLPFLHNPLISIRIPFHGNKKCKKIPFENIRPVQYA